MQITKATLADLSDILDLQKIAYLSEAQLLNNPSIPPLTQTLENMQEEYQKGIFLKALDANNKIIGSVRGYVEQETLYIGKLMVHPSFQNQGLGAKLLSAIESAYPNLRYELFTSNKSAKNLSLYTKNGYSEFKQKNITISLVFIYLEKSM